MDQLSLRRLVQEKLLDGRVPQNSIARVWGGQGNNETGVACDQVVTPTEFVMEGIGEAMRAFQSTSSASTSGTPNGRHRSVNP